MQSPSTTGCWSNEDGDLHLLVVLGSTCQRESFTVRILKQRRALRLVSDLASVVLVTIEHRSQVVGRHSKKAPVSSIVADLMIGRMP